MNCVLLKRGSSRSSLASYASTAVSMLHAAELDQLPGYVDLREGGPLLYEDTEARRTRGENMWEWYFEQPCVTAQEAASARLSWDWDPVSWPGAVSRAVVPRFLRPNGVVRRRATVLFSAYGLDPARTIALSHGTRDKAAPIEAYYRTLDALLAADGKIRLWAQPEEAHVAELLRARYGARCTTMPEFAMPDADNGYEKGLSAASLLAMFAACRVLLRNTGNLSDLASGLSKGQVFSFAADQEPTEIPATGFAGQEVRSRDLSTPPLALGDAAALMQRGADPVASLRKPSGRAIDGPGSSTRLLIIRERDIGLFSLFWQIVNTLALIEERKIDRIPIVVLGRASIYFHPSGHQGRRTAWEYYFEPLVPGWSEERVLSVLGDGAIECLESKRRQIEHQRGELEFPLHLDVLPPLSRRDWATIAHMDSLAPPPDWVWTESFDPIIDGQCLDAGITSHQTVDLVRRYVRPREYVQNLASGFFDNALKGRYVIGVQVRGTDTRACDEIPFDRYFTEIERRLATIGRGACRVFLATDEQQVVGRFEERFGDLLVCYDTVRRASGDDRFGSGPTGGPIPGYIATNPDAACKNGEDAVVEYILLGRSNFLVHNGSSLANAASLFVTDSIGVG